MWLTRREIPRSQPEHYIVEEFENAPLFGYLLVEIGDNLQITILKFSHAAHFGLFCRRDDLPIKRLRASDPGLNLLSVPGRDSVQNGWNVADFVIVDNQETIANVTTLVLQVLLEESQGSVHVSGHDAVLKRQRVDLER